MTAIRLADLVGSAVIDGEGRAQGHVVDLVIDPDAGYAVRALLVGRRGWLDRLDMEQALPKRGRLRAAERIPWDRVDRIVGYAIHLKPE